jgi:hypothetical protein
MRPESRVQDCEQKKEAGHGGQPIKLLFVKQLVTSSCLSTKSLCDYWSHTGRLGGHSGIGPERTGSLGIAPYANVPTRPTNSSNALSERFIGLIFSLGSAEH